jgi:hypothetical protein
METLDLERWEKPIILLSSKERAIRLLFGVLQVSDTRRYGRMTASDVYVVLLDYHDGRRDISDLVFQSRNEAENHAQKLEKCAEIMLTYVRRTNVI